MKLAFSTRERPANFLTSDWVQLRGQAYDFGAWTLLHLGYPDSAQRERDIGMEMVREPGASPFSYVSMLTHLLCECPWRRTPDRARVVAQELISLSDEHGLLFRKAEAQMLLGWAEAELGNPAVGLATFESGYALFLRIGFRIATPFWLTLLARIHRHARHFEEAHHAIDQALAFIEETGEHFSEPELLRLRAELWLESDRPDRDRAEQWLRAAIDLARHQNAKLVELRSSAMLARIWQSLGRNVDAYALLAPCLAWFTEGFDTRDLQDAAALLRELR